MEDDYGVIGGWSTVKNVSFRIIAVFAASGLSVLGAGAVVGIDLLSAVCMAGIIGVASVVEKLARAFLNDGELNMEEINEAFAAVDKKSGKRRA